ncbi:LysE family translocator [Nitratidesulfovibrio sp. SRB-5]|uniref:LysE family translocator n=1 Tax=Nitratidesulfovibrio sp. SRB-5 TaxID=2872636 RepID=UPI00102538F1|nr:LysE family translocator [Nitratidesulfovibrio sp. SRB-5]MBZ2172357.1 LysE family translocator [Nitratidesulfovibrio sp. SRB-5]RXF76252.1 LysE family translocator [Desulfovibrio sp. DS-1]
MSISWNFLVVYTLTVLVATITPGPSMLLALTHGVRYGVRRALASALGNTVASVLQALVAVAGLGVVLAASEDLFRVVRYAGAAYLVYVGVCMLRAPAVPLNAAATAGAAGTEGAADKADAGDTGDTGASYVPGGPGARKLFGQAFFVAAGNPKAIVFFTALFPQFLAPGDTLARSALLVADLAVIAFLGMMLYAVAGARIAALLATTRAARWYNRTVGVAFIGSGAGLALSDR